jgi:thioredoxin-dependent peroxiredoxin
MGMKERTGIVTMGGVPLTLVGDEVALGERAPDFVAVDNNLGTFRLSSLKGKIVVISAVPSLDTPVCNLETRRFNEEAANLSSDVEIITISMDLPFAQKRWCAAAGVERVKTYSDHRDADFGTKYGVLTKETRLLARAVFVLDREGTVRYIEVLGDISREPNYDEVLAAVRRLV